MSHKLLDGATAVGASRSVKVREAIIHHSVLASFQHNGVTPVTALIVVLQGGMVRPKTDTGLITPPALAIGSTPENIANGAFGYRIAGVNYTKGAVAAGTAITAGYVVQDVGAGAYGVINVYISVAGTISYGVPLDTQLYTSAALAIVAGDALLDLKNNSPVTDPALLYIGRVILFNNTGSDWDSSTDDLTNGSDITNAVFTDDRLNFIDIQTHIFSGAELTAQQALFHVPDVGMPYIRSRLASVTGDVRLDLNYSPRGGENV
jgi:hypothetical protein